MDPRNAVAVHVEHLQRGAVPERLLAHLRDVAVAVEVEQDEGRRRPVDSLALSVCILAACELQQLGDLHS